MLYNFTRCHFCPILFCCLDFIHSVDGRPHVGVCALYRVFRQANCEKRRGEAICGENFELFHNERFFATKARSNDGSGFGDSQNFARNCKIIPDS